MLEALDDGLIGDKDATVELGDEEGKEFGTRLHDLLLLVHIKEDMLKVFNHGHEKLTDQLKAQSRFKLHQKIVIIDQLLVVVE